MDTIRIKLRTVREVDMVQLQDTLPAQRDTSSNRFALYRRPSASSAGPMGRRKRHYDQR